MLTEWEMGLHHFRKHLFEEMVLAGETFTITRYGDPVAVCLPIDEYERLVEARACVPVPDATVFDFVRGEVRGPHA